MPINRRDFMKLAGWAVATGVLAACGNPQDTLTPQPTPTDGSAVSPDTPIPTNVPTKRPEVVVTVNAGAGGEIPRKVIDDFEGGRYSNEVSGLQSWIEYWKSVNRLNPATKHEIAPLPDQNNEAIVGIYVNDADGERWLFPPLKDGVPMYENSPAPDPGGQVAPGCDVLTVHKVITREIAVSQGYDGAMADWLNGSELTLRGEQLTRMKHGQIIAYVDRQSGKWVKELSSPPVTTNHAEYGAFAVDPYDRSNLDYAARHDTTPCPDLSQIVFPEYSVGNVTLVTGKESTRPIGVVNLPDQTISDIYKDPNKRNHHVVGYGGFLHPKYGVLLQVRYVKFVNKDQWGSVSWLTLAGGGNAPELGPKDINLPLVSLVSESVEHNEGYVQYLEEYAATGIIPEPLNYSTVWGD